MSLSAKDIVRLYSQLKGERATWEALWQDVSDYALPDRGDFTTDRTAGSRRTTKMYDQTPAWAIQQTAAAHQALLTPAHQVWAWMRASDPALDAVEPVSRWLHVVSRRLHAMMTNPRSRFLQAMYQVSLDVTALGTGVMYVGEDAASEWPLRFEARHLSECLLFEGQFGAIEGVVRKFQLNALRIRDAWPDWSPPKEIIEAVDEPTKKFDFIHYVAPRREGRGGLSGADKPVASIYVYCAGAEVIDEGGFDEMPFIVARWSVQTNEIYGRGPTITALPDIKMLHAQRRTMIRAAQKLAEPPWVFPDDATILPLKFSPNAVNFMEPGGERPFALVANGRPDIGMQELEVSREQIARAHHVDLLRLPDRDRMTATEVMQHREDAMRVLGPTIGRQEAEFLSPLIDRVFAIADRASVFPEPPEELAGQELRIDYDSPLSRSARAHEAQAIDALMLGLQPFLAVKPDLADMIDFEAALRLKANIRGVPPEVLRPAEAVQALGGDHARRAEMIQLASAAGVGAEAMAKAASATKDLAAAQAAGAA